MDWRARAPSQAERRASISAFYLSNVDYFLRLDKKWVTFCRNAAQLPVTETALFIRVGEQRRDSTGRRLDSFGWSPDRQVRVFWSDGTRDTLSEPEFAKLLRTRAPQETGSLRELIRSCQ
jgi:hypothetical protein